MGALIELKNIGYSYHNLAGETGAIKDVSFQVEEGEFVALVGPSGCGKSTLLSIIAGLLAPETGTIVVNNPDGSLHYPRVGYMLQHDHLFEWRTIYQNVTLGLEIHHALTKERTDYVKQLLSDYGLESFQDKRPSELSGGMKQRAALIRTLALDPQLLLLDEPFSALDYQTRLMVSADICRLIRQSGGTENHHDHRHSRSVGSHQSGRQGLCTVCEAGDDQGRSPHPAHASGCITAGCQKCARISILFQTTLGGING